MKRRSDVFRTGGEKFIQHARVERTGCYRVDVNVMLACFLGESFYETPGSRHPVSRNASKTKPARLLAVFVVDTDDKELTTPVK